MALEYQFSESFLAYQLHSAVQMSGWKLGLEPGKNIFKFSICLIEKGLKRRKFVKSRSF